MMERFQGVCEFLKEKETERNAPGGLYLEAEDLVEELGLSAKGG